MPLLFAFSLILKGFLTPFGGYFFDSAGFSFAVSWPPTWKGAAHAAPFLVSSFILAG
jgi:hypothetical protein